MNSAFEVGAAALRAQQRAMEIHANNVANVNTPTFKRSDARYSEALAEAAASADAAGAAAQRSPLGGSGVRVVQEQVLFAQGELRATGNPLDLGIDGRGMIELIGPGRATLLWRGGALRVNEDGLLATAEGMPLRAGIVVPQDAESLAIAPDGLVSVSTSGGETIEIGQIDLVRVDYPAALERLDNGLFRPVPEARLTDARPGEDGTGMLSQGSIEESNVSLTQEMVQMLLVQRAYAASAQIVQAADQIAAITNNLKS